MDKAWRVLLVEDDPDHSELIAAALVDAQPGCVVDVAPDGESALRLLRDSSAESAAPLLILLDLRLAGRDGLEVLCEIKSDDELRRIPVIVLSASTAKDDVQRAFDCHANSYVAKPAGLTDLRATVRRVIEYWSGCHTGRA